MQSVRQNEPVGGLSQASIRAAKLRDRKRRICNIIHNTTWLAESGTILTTIIFQLGLTIFSIDQYIINSLSDTISALTFWRIVAPYTHLFNEERIKIIILEEGWLSAMVAALQFKVTNENRNRPSQNRTFTTDTSNSMKVPETIHHWKNKRNERKTDKRIKVFLVEKNLTDTMNKKVVVAHEGFVASLPNAVIDE